MILVIFRCLYQIDMSTYIWIYCGVLSIQGILRWTWNENSATSRCMHWLRLRPIEWRVSWAFQRVSQMQWKIHHLWVISIYTSFSRGFLSKKHEEWRDLLSPWSFCAGLSYQNLIQVCTTARRRKTFSKQAWNASGVTPWQPFRTVHHRAEGETLPSDVLGKPPSWHV